jgi:hypothetical protein
MLEMVMLLPLLTRLHLGFYQGSYFIKAPILSRLLFYQGSYMSAAVLLVGATF